MISRKKRARNNKATKYQKSNSRETQDEKESKQIDDFQPQILRKPESAISTLTLSESDEKKKSVDVPETVKKVEPLPINHSVVLVNRNHVDVVLLHQYLDLENTNFYVVGVIGMKDSGKSTLLNFIATGEIHRCEVNGKSSVQSPLFDEFKHGNGVNAFVTSTRLILLDSAPLMNNTSCREFIASEADDIRQVQVMLRLCHELIIVYESHQLMSLVRMLICAKNMLKPYECDEPEITLVENRVQPGIMKNPMTEIAKLLLTRNNISDCINFVTIPDLDCIKTHHDDPVEFISKLRDDINTRKELKTFEEPSETEKSWWDKVSKLNTDVNFFLLEYEALRGKFYQPNESCYYTKNCVIEK